MKPTVTQCQSAKPKEKSYKLTDGGGLYLEVLPTGKKHWRLQYSFQGKRPRISLGPFPSVSLLAARAEREKQKQLLRDGMNPIVERRAEKLRRQIKTKNTFEAVATEWHSVKSSNWSAGYKSDTLARLKRDVLPAIGSMPLVDIELPHVLAIMRTIENRRSYDIARRNLQMIGRVFRYGMATGRCTADPSYRLWEALRPTQKTHHAALDWTELPGFIQCLRTNKARLYPQTLIATELLMLTFVRTKELIGAIWEEVDLENARWLIPGERMKRAKEHIVPLSKQAIELFEEARKWSGGSRYIFPHQFHSDRHMSNCTILRAIGRMGYKGRMTGHGFRALAMSTIKEQLGYRHEVIDRQLAHVPANKVDRAYDRAQFLDDRKRMMQDWADYIDECATKACEDAL